MYNLNRSGMRKLHEMAEDVVSAATGSGISDFFKDMATSVIVYPHVWSTNEATGQRKIAVDLPGVDKGSLDVSYVHGDKIAVKATRTKADGWTAIAGNNPFALANVDFVVAVPPRSLLGEASFQDGVLTIVFEPQPEARPRKIDIVTDGVDKPKGKTKTVLMED